MNFATPQPATQPTPDPTRATSGGGLYAFPDNATFADVCVRAADLKAEWIATGDLEAQAAWLVADRERSRLLVERQSARARGVS
jgi:hypothetical protein